MGRKVELNEETRWAYRFHRDEKSWVRDPKVFVDMGRGMPDGSPPFSKQGSTYEENKQKRSGKGWFAAGGRQQNLFGGLLPMFERRTERMAVLTKSLDSSPPLLESHLEEGERSKKTRFKTFGREKPKVFFYALRNHWGREIGLLNNRTLLLRVEVVNCPQ